jgi:WhiB family redox-sensing transcriptional regulator
VIIHSESETMMAREHPTTRIDPPGVEDWWPRAACKGTDQNVFFADDSESIVAAKAVCARCPVREQCLDFAFQGRHHGIWGGTTDKERARLRRDQRRQKQEQRPSMDQGETTVPH